VVAGLTRMCWQYWLIDLGAIVIIRLATDLLQGFILRAFFDLLAGPQPARFGIWAVLALLASLFLARILGEWGFVTADVPIFNQMALALRRSLLGQILRRPGAAALPEAPGETLNRLRSDVVELPLSVLWFNDILTGLLVVAAALVVLLRINAAVTLAALLPVALTYVVSNAATGRVGRYRQAARQAAAEVSGFLAEFFGGVQSVKVAAAEAHVLRRLHGLNDRRRSLALRERLFDEIMNALYRNTAGIATGILLLMAGQAMQSGRFTVGDFSLFVFLLQRVSSITTYTGMVVSRYKQMNVSVERMEHLMAGAPPGAGLNALARGRLADLNAAPPPIPEPVSGADPLETLTVTGLTAAARQAADAQTQAAQTAAANYAAWTGIHHIDLRLQRGTLTVITGRVGSGKTTLLRVLLGLLPRDAGEIAWNGRPVTDPATFFQPPRCAYTPQIPHLFSASLRANLLLGLPRSDDELRAALRLAVMDADLAGLAAGLDTLLGPHGVRLSGGQVQRAAAARMFLRRPDLLVFDDLSSALDVETETSLWHGLLDGPRGGYTPTLLAVSHRRPVLRRADQVIVLEGGRVAGRGSLQELLQTCPEMRRIWNLETTGEPTAESA
jgi:ATP-binding cassette subfamily B protein